MTAELRAALDAPVLTADYFLYRLQELTGFDKPACAVIEEFRGLCKHFQSVMPTALPQPGSDARERRIVVRKSLGKIKWEVSRSWDRRELTPDDMAVARKLHATANEVMRLLGIDVRPPGKRSDVVTISPTDWCIYLRNMSQSFEAIERVQADLGLLSDAGIAISAQPEPAADNIIYSIRRFMADASAAFGHRYNYLIRRFHADCKALRAALEEEGVIVKERAA